MNHIGYMSLIAAYLSGLMLMPNVSSGRDMFHEVPELSNPDELLQQSWQYRLLNDILSKDIYDPRVRPVRDMRQPVMVQLKMMLYQIIDVVEPEQTIILNTWITQYWTDEFLGWLPLSYGGIETVMLPTKDVWTPDTYLYNSLEMSQESTEHLMNVIITTEVRPDGPPVAQITMMYPAIYKFSCSLYVKYFPFDKQQCRMSFGSWTYDIMGINYTQKFDYVLLDEYKTSEEWKLLSFTWNRTESLYSCCPYPYVMLHAELVIQRKPLFHIVNLILPSAIIALVAICGFFMPTNTLGERSEKVNLGITTLLAMAILLLMVVDQMPATSQFVPLMGWFYLIVIGMISLGTLLTSGIICLQRNAEYGRPMTRFWLTFAKLVGPILCVPVKRQLRSFWKRQEDIKKKRPERSHTFDNGDVLDDMTMSTLIRDVNTIDINLNTTNNNGHDCTLCSHAPPKLNEEEVRQLEWEHVAECVDRVLLITFGSAVIMVTSGILLVGWTVMEDEIVRFE